MLVKSNCTPRDIHSHVRGMHPLRMGRRKVKVVFAKTYIREWREFRGLTLERLAERVGERIGGFTHASLSRIERGLQPYSQPVLEAIGEALNIDPASLLMRNPSDPEGIWTVWEQAKKGQKQIIIDLAKTIIKSAS
jgi:transcriptional regulator with XRE-family HTH domain